MKKLQSTRLISTPFTNSTKGLTIIYGSIESELPHGFWDSKSKVNQT